MFGRVFSVLALATGLAVASVAAAVPSGAGVSTAALPRPFVVYDAIGDAPGVPDITSTAVARDSRNRLTFAINVANHPSMKRGDLFSIGIDADRRLATGSNGVDVIVELGWSTGEKEPTYAVGRWDGSAWQSLDIPAGVTYLASGPHFTVAGSGIGVGRSFRFAARAARLAAPGKDAADGAPGMGLASVALSAPAEIAEMSRLMIPLPSLLPQAGTLLRVRGIEISIASDQTDVAPGIGVGSVVKPEKIRCTAKIGRVQLRPVGACAWRVPNTARGKTLMLKVTVAYRGDELTRVYPLEVE
jgi:hypothetical protein